MDSSNLQHAQISGIWKCFLVDQEGKPKTDAREHLSFQLLLEKVYFHSVQACHLNTLEAPSHQ